MGLFRLKIKSQEVLGANSFVCRSYRGKLVGGLFLFPILNRVIWDICDVWVDSHTKICNCFYTSQKYSQICEITGVSIHISFSANGKLLINLEAA